MSKVDRAIHGPSWTEVILGALLSLVLGVILAALVLALKPVVVVKEMPKEQVAGAVYYIAGLSGDSSSSRQALAKRKAFVDGRSVEVTEGELNSLIAAAAAPTPAAKPGEKGAPAAPAKTDEMVATGTPNVRIRNGSMQIAVPVTLNVAGFTQNILVQARGGFEKDGSVFVYEPSELYFGSCPVQRLPFLAGYIKSKLLASHPVPEDIAVAWAKLSNVAIDGNKLTLAMQ